MQTERSLIETSGAPPAAYSPRNMITEIKEQRGHEGRRVTFNNPTVTISPSVFQASPAFAKFNVPSSPVVSLTLEIKGRTGESASLSHIPFRIQSSRTGSITLSSEAQNTSWLFRITVHLDRKQMAMKLSLNYSGLSVRKVSEGVRFYDQLAKGGEFRILGQHPITGGEIQLARGRIPSGKYAKPDERLVNLLERLAFIEHKTGVSFRIPERNITLEDAKAIAATEHILKTGHAQYKAEPWESVSPLNQAKASLQTFSGGQVIPTAIHFEDQIQVIFGTEVPLGPVTFFCDRTFITEKDLKALRQKIGQASPTSTIRFRLTPSEGAVVEARYINWLPEDEAAAVSQLPMYQKDKSGLSQPSNVPSQANPAVALLDSWYEEDSKEQKPTWRLLKTALDRGRLSERKLFP